MHKITKLAATGTFAALLAAPAHAITITAYSDNFDASPILGAGVTAHWSALSASPPQSVQGYNGLGNGGNTFGGNFLSSFGAPLGVSDGSPSNGATLTLSNLPGHTSVNITALLAVIDSWDSSDGSCCSPDFFEIEIDGTTLVFSDTYNNVLGSVNNVAGLTDIGSGKVHRGFNGGWVDQAFDMENELANLAHTASTLSIQFLGTGAGWQGGTDEAWGIDNLLVQLNGVVTTPPPVTGVPEPMTLSLLGAGLLGLGIARRKRA